MLKDLPTLYLKLFTFTIMFVLCSNINLEWCIRVFCLLQYFNILNVLFICFNLWPDLPKPATYVHNGIERFSSPIDSSINKLTSCHNTTATSWLVCFFWGLVLRPVRRPRVLGCSLSATGWLVQAATLLKITTWLIHDVGHGFSYILWHFQCNGASF